MYWWGPRFLTPDTVSGLPDPSPHQYTFHPWEIRTQTLYCALAGGCLADPVWGAFRGKDGDSYCRKEIKWFHEATEKAFGTKMLLAGN